MAARGLANLYIHMTPKGKRHPGGMQIYQRTWYVTLSKALGAAHPSGVVHIYKSNSSLVCYNVLMSEMLKILHHYILCGIDYFDF